MYFAPMFTDIIGGIGQGHSLAKIFISALTSLILPYILLHLLLFNLFKKLNKVNVFLYNSTVHLCFLIGALFLCAKLGINLVSIPYILLLIFLAWYISSEYLLSKIDSLFMKGTKYRVSSVILFVLIMALLVDYVPAKIMKNINKIV